MVTTILHDFATVFSVALLALWSVAAKSHFIHEQGKDKLSENLILYGGWAATLWLAFT